MARMQMCSEFSELRADFGKDQIYLKRHGVL